MYHYLKLYVFAFILKNVIAKKDIETINQMTEDMYLDTTVFSAKL